MCSLSNSQVHSTVLTKGQYAVHNIPITFLN